MNTLPPDREMLSRFAEIMFKHASPKGYVSLRAFPDTGSRGQKALFVYPITLGDKKLVDMLFEHARQAAEWPVSAVFCPPVATFRDHKNAKADNICEGVALSVECDERPREARHTLEVILGEPTVTVASGGQWTKPETGKIEPKVHLHWRLNRPTGTPEEHAMLKEARKLATELVDGDGSNISIVHPIRWPGSWHRKTTARLARIVASSENEIGLAEALDLLRDASGAAEFAGFGFTANSRLCAENSADVASALDVIPNDNLQWVDWNKFGLAIWAATGGSEAGREAFAVWSAKAKKNVAETTNARWQHYRTSPPDRIGFGTLVYWARHYSPGWTYGPAIDVERLNKKHAVLPIGGKTRVVTFGELEDFPGRETIVMTQTIADYKSLNDKYRHSWRDEKGKLKSTPMGTHWIGSPKRRQYDGGMAFMPRYDGDVGNRLNLYRGFGVKPIKPDGTSGAAGCQIFLDFMRDIICNGNEVDFDYLRKREATILQKRIRTEIALGLRTKEEGCGKGFYEATMGRLLGNHAMQVTNPKHIIGNFNPHLETLLRLTADEALFVHNPEHRNALFGLITEPTLTIEPKGCGVYKADNYLNVSLTSNADHFLPVSGTARRFFIPTVSAARKQDFAYFAALKAELENGGYEALLYHLLHEVNLADFDVRKVPQTEELRQQRNLSLPPLEAWWCELLETGTLCGADPKEPHRAVSNSYQRQIETKTPSGYGGTTTHIRHVNQLGIYDQARQLEPRLKNYVNDHRLGAHLSEMGCDNTYKVLRRRGWTFRPLSDCRAEWEKRYPGWPWRDPAITKWRAEEADDVVTAGSDEAEDADDDNAEGDDHVLRRSARF